MSDELAQILVWMGTTVAVMLGGVQSNRWELYGIAGLSFLLYALNYIPDWFAIVALILAFANVARMVWCWLGSRPRDLR